MTRILFICHGNICRSPMAEYIMKALVKEQRLEKDFEIASAATSREEIGNSLYPPAQRKLREHGIPFGAHAARQMTRADYLYYDKIIAMEAYSLRNLRPMVGNDPDQKVSLLMDYTRRPGDVADPWYTGDFETAYQDILEGCQGLLKAVLQER